MLNIPWPRQMRDYEDKDVRELFKLCHLRQPEPLSFWYFAHPTLVVEIDDKIVGSTSFTIVIVPGFGSTLYGKDLCVHPDYRGHGIAELLHTARLSIGGLVGASTFMGMTHKDNMKMIRILEKSGMHRCIPVGNDLLFTGPIPEV